MIEMASRNAQTEKKSRQSAQLQAKLVQTREKAESDSPQVNCDFVKSAKVLI